MFALTASIFTQILAHKPPNLEILSSQAPNLEIFRSQAPLSEANVSSQAPHFGNPGRTLLPEKKLSAPPRGNTGMCCPQDPLFQTISSSRHPTCIF